MEKITKDNYGAIISDGFNDNEKYKVNITMDNHDTYTLSKSLDDKVTINYNCHINNNSETAEIGKHSDYKKTIEVEDLGDFLFSKINFDSISSVVLPSDTDPDNKNFMVYYKVQGKTKLNNHAS